MNFDDLIRFAPPPPNRVRSCAGEGVRERSEAANLIAAAMTRIDSIHPSAEIESARETLSSLAYMYSGSHR
jgi:hypothetical protein